METKPTCVHNCNYCQHFIFEEIGDYDYGALYADEQSCNKYLDTDPETEEEVLKFDREIKRECAVPDFWKVVEHDSELDALLWVEIDRTEGSFNETYEKFKAKYL